MDEDLLADDGQYKDDGLEDLDNETEAALLGISDEELDDNHSHNDDQELEYVDEEGNPVAIGENNADLYEVANIQSNKPSNVLDEDVLELDLDTELDSFQETSDNQRESPTPTKSFSDRQRKENLISLTSRKEPERPPIRRKESRYSPERDQEISFSNQHVSHIGTRDFGGDLEYDEESEDENMADDHRERFKSERSNIIMLTPAKRRTDIPDTLESVISVEETAKVQAFLENEQKRKMRFKGRMQGRMKPSPRFQRPTQNFGTPQNQQPPRFSTANVPPVSQPTSSAPQPTKILINPHFRGPRQPPPTEPAPVHPINEPPPSMPTSSYEPSNFTSPSAQYSHHEPVHPLAVGPPPIYTTPPPAMHYKPPEYPPPQLPIPQVPPPTWQQPPPEMPVQPYSVPPPPIANYGDPVQQPPSYNPNYQNTNQYNQNFSNTSYQNAPVSLPQSVNYSQPPPPVPHIYTQSFPTPPVNLVSSNMAPTHYSPAASQIRMQTSVQPQQYRPSISRAQMTSPFQKPKFPQNTQRFSRPEKRMATTNTSFVSSKQPRLDHPPKKTNVHVNNSNIREIPLVDTLPSFKRPTAPNKAVPIIEEDEKTRELRMKIEEQKLIREEVLRRKEERRRQMAAQRLMELKRRQGEQTKNTVTIVPKTSSQLNKVEAFPQVKQAVKPSVKERIGPFAKNVPLTKKKIVVVRKKMPQPNTVASAPTMKTATAVGQRIKLPVSSQKSSNQQTTVSTAIKRQNKQVICTKPIANQPAKSVVPTKLATSKTQNTVINLKKQPASSTKLSLVSQAQKIKNLRLRIRPNLQRPQFPHLQRMHRPRIPGPGGMQFPPPSPPVSFGEPRMPFHNRGPPMSDIRMPPPHFPEPHPRFQGPQRHFQGPRPPFQGPPPHFQEVRSQFPGPQLHFQEPHPQFNEPRPILPFRNPPGDPGRFNNFFPHERPPNSPPFHMRGPAPPNFRPRGMEQPMFRERFPPPQFRNQVPQMRHPIDNNMRFQRPPRFRPKFTPNNRMSQKPANEPAAVAVKSPTPKSDPQTVSVNKKPIEASRKPIEAPANTSEDKSARKICLTRNPPVKGSNEKDIPKTSSVSIENLSSSTNEAQLKKLCTAVGVVENIKLLKSERKAVIKFKEPGQALMFQKKYQRYMLDLAMIQVTLLSS